MSSPIRRDDYSALFSFLHAVISIQTRYRVIGEMRLYTPGPTGNIDNTLRAQVCVITQIDENIFINRFNMH